MALYRMPVAMSGPAPLERRYDERSPRGAATTNSTLSARISDHGRLHLHLSQLRERAECQHGNAGSAPEEHGALDDVAARPGREGPPPLGRPAAAACRQAR